MEQWTFTSDTALAAAFGTLGMPLRVLRDFISGHSAQTVRFGIGLLSTDGGHKTKKLTSDLKSGKLAVSSPDHPLLVMLAAFRNREKLLDCANRGAGIRLERENGSLIHSYRPGDSGLPGVPLGAAIIRTGDIKLAATLATLGCRLLAIEGERNRRLFSLDANAPALPDGRPVNAPGLMLDWRAAPESVPWEHPFAQAMRGFHNRERLLDCINRSAIKVSLIHPSGGRFAVVTADSAGNLPGKAMDAVRNFFDT